MKPQTSLGLFVCLLLLLSNGFQAEAFYDATPGRWLNRDPIGEEGGASLYGHSRNGLVGAIDVLGLLGTPVIRQVSYTYHGSVEIDPNSTPYLLTGDRTASAVPFSGGWSKPGATISVSLSALGASLTAWIRASTSPGALAPPTQMQMSTDLGGTVKVCAPCCDRIRAYWRLDAIASGPKGRGNADFQGTSVLANASRGHAAASGVEVLDLDRDGCATAVFDVGQAWLTSGTAVDSSRALVVASFECNE